MGQAAPAKHSQPALSQPALYPHLSHTPTRTSLQQLVLSAPQLHEDAPAALLQHGVAQQACCLRWGTSSEQQSQPPASALMSRQHPPGSLQPGSRARRRLSRGLHMRRRCSTSCPAGRVAGTMAPSRLLFRWAAASQLLGQLCMSQACARALGIALQLQAFATSAQRSQALKLSA